MKHISKGAEPAELIQWRLNNESTPQVLTYENLPKDALRDALLQEQGYICAYTMLRIASTSDGHIEHIIPRWRSDVLSIEYLNMVYCYPGTDVPNCKFGAGRKAGQQIEDFVSPINPACEARLFFSRNGSVSSSEASDKGAENTIRLLNLNHNILVEGRKAAIAKLPINRTRRPLTALQAERLARELIERGADGKFLEFAVALAQSMSRYARQRAAQR